MGRFLEEQGRHALPARHYLVLVGTVPVFLPRHIVRTALAFGDTLDHLMIKVSEVRDTANLPALLLLQIATHEYSVGAQPCQVALHPCLDPTMKLLM